MIIIIIYDFEVFKYDWMIAWLDTETQNMHYIINDKGLFEKFYEYYKDQLWVGYNSRGYDQWIAKAILCGFNPYEMNDWIINKGNKGFMFSRQLYKFPIINYDCSMLFKSLKELEAFQGHSIVESDVPWDIDRPLTKAEIKKTLEYCKTDVMETFGIFVDTAHEFESHIGLVQEFELSREAISKTKAQISALILEAVRINRDDEFDVWLPDTLQLNEHKWIGEWYLNWGKNVKDYNSMSLKTDINDVEHTFGIGGLHAGRKNYYGEGYYLMADVASYYPAMIIEYGFMSRNVSDPSKYCTIRDERIIMKSKGDKRQLPRKIVLNSTYGAMKDPYNALYDPLMANNICIAGQLLLVDLLDKLNGKCELIQTNTDGILIKLFNKNDKDYIIGICEEWSKRTRMDLEYDEYSKVIQRDVNNYMILPHGELYDAKGKELFKRKGAVVKKLNPLDNNLPIVNEAIVNYFLTNKPIYDTINECQELLKFQLIKKVSSKYEFAFKVSSTGGMNTFKARKLLSDQRGSILVDKDYRGYKLHEKVHRVFASTNPNDGGLFKKHKSKSTLEKMASTPDNCFINNGDITNASIPSNLDKQWYIDLAEDRIKKFI